MIAFEIPAEEAIAWRGVKPADFPARVSLGCRLAAERKRREKDPPPEPPPEEGDGDAEG